MKSRQEILSWVILLIIIISSLITHSQLSSMRNTLESDRSSLPKMKISDVKQFQQLTIQLVEQWSSRGISIYLLQPKDNAKTHKEKAISTIECSVEWPTRSQLTDKSLFTALDKNDFVKITSTDILNQSITNASLCDESDLAMLTIRKNSTIVGEIFVEYPKGDLPNNDALRIMSLEAQVLERLLY